MNAINSILRCLILLLLVSICMVGCASTFKQPSSDSIDLIVHVYADASNDEDVLQFIDGQLLAARELLIRGGIAIRGVSVVADLQRADHFSTQIADGMIQALLDRSAVGGPYVHIYIAENVDRPTTVGATVYEVTNRCRALIVVQYNEGQVTQLTGRTTMAHELGHMFGLRHRLTPSNVMKPGLRSLLPKFTNWQYRKMQRRIRTWKNRCAR